MKFSKYLWLAGVLLATACTHSRKDMLVGNWQGTKLENTNIDSFFIKSQQVIDTLGKYNDPDRNFELYGTSNMDSVRHILQLQHDSALLAQNQRITHTFFRFVADRNAYLTFNDHKNTDTAHWSLDDEGALLVEDHAFGSSHTVKRMQVLQLTDSVLRLQIWSNDDSSKITFRKTPE
jgi:hypothetical protein